MTGSNGARVELDAGFRHLSPDLRAILVLHYYVGMPMPAVAETLGVPLGTAQSRLHRALEGLRRAMGRPASKPASVAHKGQVA